MTTETNVTVPAALLAKLMQAVSDLRKITLRRAEDCRAADGRMRPGMRGAHGVYHASANDLNLTLANASAAAGGAVKSTFAGEVDGSVVRFYFVEEAR